MDAKIERDGAAYVLVMRIPLSEDPPLSSSGKTRLAASLTERLTSVLGPRCRAQVNIMVPVDWAGIPMAPGRNVTSKSPDKLTYTRSDGVRVSITRTDSSVRWDAKIPGGKDRLVRWLARRQLTKCPIIDILRELLGDDIGSQESISAQTRGKGTKYTTGGGCKPYGVLPTREQWIAVERAEPLDDEFAIRVVRTARKLGYEIPLHLTASDSPYKH